MLVSGETSAQKTAVSLINDLLTTSQRNGMTSQRLGNDGGGFGGGTAGGGGVTTMTVAKEQVRRIIGELVELSIPNECNYFTAVAM